MRYKKRLSALLLAGLLASGAAAQDQVPPPADAIADTMRSMFDALAMDDVPKLRAILTEDFYAFDGGHTLTADELFTYVKSQHSKGIIYTWSVTETRTHISGDWASITYRNKGSITEGASKVPMTWLEAAILRREKGRWRIEFIDSTRTPLAPGTPLPPSGDKSPKSTYK